ncbi:MAG: glycoside hydrolase family 32 protein [Ilumatobacter sp.]|nr:glycoside hydrolase family 32 protein [Ilumatobacter sp.]
MVEPVADPPDDRHRPIVHFTARQHWINDPNGPIILDGRAHLYFQHNPNGSDWGDISWGHAVSDDLLNWDELPVAIPAAPDHMIFSGSTAITDDGVVAAFYTGHRPDADPRRVRQDQRVAISRDGGLTFRPFATNPVIDLDLVDFRDPNVFRHDPTGRWVMVVSLPDRHQLVVFGSVDLVSWEECSRFGPVGATGGIWECPALFEVPVLDHDGRAVGRRWVLKVDHNPGHVSGGSGGQYFIGDFDGSAFVPEHPTDAPLWVDRGADFYGALPFAGESSTAERTWIAWMSNWDYAHDTPTAPWRGAMTLPRRIALVEREGRHVLVQRPSDTVDRAAPVVGGADLVADGATLEVPDAYRLRLVAVGADLSIRLGFGPAEVVVSYDRHAATLTVDRSRSGERPNDRFTGVHTASLSTPVVRDVDRDVDLDIVVDRSSVEVFADRGSVVFTELCFPPPGPRTITVSSHDRPRPSASRIRLDSLVR